MPKRTVELYLFDIVLSIDRVRRFSKQIRSVSTLMINEMLCSAVLRELGIIGETMCHVLQEKKDVFSSVEEELKLLKRKNSLLYLKKIKVIIDKKSC
jgi:uncharacterized protein with HEPN domain